MAERKNSFREIIHKSLSHSRVVPSPSLSLLVLRFQVQGFFFTFSFQSLSKMFDYLEVKTLPRERESLKMHHCKCQHWVKQWLLCHHLLTPCVVRFPICISQSTSSSKYFSFAAKNVSSLMHPLGRCLASLERFHFEHLLPPARFRSQKLMKLAGILSVELL